MSTIRAVFIASIVFCLACPACSPQPAAGPVAEAKPVSTEEPTTAPSPTPSPTETKAPVEPVAGASYSGPLIGIKNAAGGLFSLQVSSDGRFVERFSLMLTQIKCETFSSDMIIQAFQGNYPLSAGVLEAEISGLGRVAVQFTEPDTVQGKIELVYKPAFGGQPCDMGEIAWLGKLSEKQTGQSEQTTVPIEPTAELLEIPTLQISAGPTVPPAPQLIRTTIPKDDKIQIVNDRVVLSEDKVIILGEVENNSAFGQYNLRIAVRLLDSAGKVLVEEDAGANAHVCMPGERVSFSTIIQKPSNFGGYSLQLFSTDFKEELKEYLKITEDKMAGPYAHVIGWAEAVGNSTIQFPQVNAVFYDAEGKVCGTGMSYFPAPGSVLAPGDRRPFSVMVLHGEASDKYRLFVDRGQLGEPKPAELEILESKVENWRLKGKIRNTTGKTAGFPSVMAAFYDSGGSLIDVQTSIVTPFGDLADGAEAAFEFMTAPTGFVRYEVFASYSP